MTTLSLLLILLFGTLVAVIVCTGLSMLLAGLLWPELEMEILAYGSIGGCVGGILAFIGLFYWVVGY